jgi:hypothetical protein
MLGIPLKKAFFPNLTRNNLFKSFLKESSLYQIEVEYAF